MVEEQTMKSVSPNAKIEKILRVTDYELRILIFAYNYVSNQFPDQSINQPPTHETSLVTLAYDIH
jgi:hypothetical protein